MRFPLRGIRPYLLVLGPGIVSGFADNDAGGITTYSLAGAQFGYGLMWALLATMLALAVTQEVGARLGLATGQGLGGVIRERFGVKWTGVAAVTMLAANLGTTISEFAGNAAALSLFGVPIELTTLVTALLMIVVLARGSFSRIQFVFLGTGVAVSIAYAVSAWLTSPDWAHATRSLIVPEITPSQAYFLALVGVVGTTITPWGQAFIQSYVADKGLGPRHLKTTRVDVALGSVITNVVAWFIVIACAQTIWAHGLTINDASDAAKALGPLAGPAATTIFAVGLLAASLIGLGTVPLTSAYFTCEAFGWESGVRWRWQQAPAFYGLLTFFIGFAALFVLIPGLPLIQVMFLAQVFNGVLLPVILIFVMKSSASPSLGPLRSGRVLRTLGWTITGLVSLMSITFVISLLLAR